MIKLGRIEFIVLIAFLQITVCVSIIFDIPVVRQIISFLYFTFVPGYTILKILSFDDLDNIDILLLSAGLSIAFLMLIGLLVNIAFLIVGFQYPLSTHFLLIFYNILILICCIVVYIKKQSPPPALFAIFRVTPSVLLFLSLPIISILGAMLVNIFGINIVLLFLIFCIILLFLLVIIYNEFLPPKLYPLAVYAIALSLILHSALISKYVNTFSSDIPVEYYVAKNTQNNLFWNSTIPAYWDNGYGRTNAMLSVTILPAVYSNLLGIELYWVFKLVYPLIFSIVPIILYRIWQPYVGEKYAFISAFLFMSQNTFYTEILGLSRQLVAELFYSLLIFILFKRNVKTLNRLFYFITFSLALIISHYGIAEILLAFMLLSWISLIFIRKPSRKLNTFVIMYFCTTMFLWYIYTSNSATFKSLLSYGNYVYEQLGDFFNPKSRGETVLRGLGLEPPPTIWNFISRFFAYLTEILIALGFVGLLMKRVSVKLEIEQLLFTSASMCILGTLILIPGLANTMNMTRFYHILLFFLAFLFVLGAKFIVRVTLKHTKELISSILLAFVLIPYFLFQVGFIYEIVGCKNWSLPLSGYRADPFQLYISFGYIDAESVYGSIWLHKTLSTSETYIHADIVSRANVLSIYGNFYQNNIQVLSNITNVCGSEKVYLSKLNVIHGVIVESGIYWNVNEFSGVFNMLTPVYTNGGSNVYVNSTK